MAFGNLVCLHLLWLIPFLILIYVYSFLRKDAALKIFCGEVLRPRLVPASTRSRQKLKACLMILVVFFMVAAMIRPKWGFRWENIKRTGVDIIVAIDVSKSMLAQDIEPSRLERAKRKVSDLVEMLEGDRIGLIAFAGTAFVQCPLTLDYGAFKMFLSYLSPDLIPVPGTAIGDAVRKATAAFNRHERSPKALILITDGEDHNSDPLEAAQEAKKMGVKIFAIGIGNDTGAPVPNPDGSGGFIKDRSGNVVLSKLNEQLLQKIALETGGAYVRSVTGDVDLTKIYREGIRSGMERKELSATRNKRWEERFQWFIAVAFLLLIVESCITESGAKGSVTVS